MNLSKQNSWRHISQGEIRNSAAAEKKWNRKARAGKNSFPPTPFLFARPSDWILKFRIRIFFKESSNIVQKTPHWRSRIVAIAPVLKTGTLHGVRGFESHLLRQFIHDEFFASPRLRRGSASAKILKGFSKSKTSF